MRRTFHTLVYSFNSLGERGSTGLTTSSICFISQSRHPWVNAKITNCLHVLTLFSFFQIMIKKIFVIAAGNYKHRLTTCNSFSQFENKPTLLMRNLKLNCSSWTLEELKQSRKTKMCFLPAEYPSSVRATPLWDTAWFISHRTRHTSQYRQQPTHFRTFRVQMMRCCVHTGPGLGRRS